MNKQWLRGVTNDLERGMLFGQVRRKYNLSWSVYWLVTEYAGKVPDKATLAAIARLNRPNRADLKSRAVDFLLFLG